MCQKAYCSRAQIFLSVSLALIHRTGDALNMKSKLPSGCFSSHYTADMCCHQTDDNVEPFESNPFCWQRWDGEVKNVEALKRYVASCCDDEAVSVANEVKDRWPRAMQGPDQLTNIAGCKVPRRIAPNHVRFLSYFVHFHDFSTQLPHETADEIANRMLWRVGHIDYKGRCDSDGSRVNADLARLHQILNENGVKPVGWIINLGAGSWRDFGWEMVRRNLSGIFIDGSGPPKGFPVNPRVNFITDMATPSNLHDLISRGGLRVFHGANPLPIDFLKIDIDSCDCVMAAVALRLVKPRLIIMEINMAFPPPLRFARQCHEDFWDQYSRWCYHGRIPITHGCSLSEAVKVMNEAGYSLYSFKFMDAVFVDKNYADLVGGADVDEISCYRQAIVGNDYFLHSAYVHEWIHAEPHDALKHAWCNLTVHDYLLGMSDIPYTLGL